MRRLGLLLVRLRWPVLAFVAAAVALVGSQARNLREDLSFETLYLSGDPDIPFSEEFSHTFENINDMVVIVLTGREIFSPEVLERVERLTERLDGLEHVDNVYSLGNIRYIQGRGEDLDVGEFLEEVPAEPARLAELRAQALAYRLFRRRLLSEDAAYTGIVAQTADVFGSPAERRAFLAGVEEIVAEHVPAGCRHYITGTNVVEKGYARIIARDRLIFILLAAAAVLAGLFLIFRSVPDTLAAMAALGASAVLSLGVVHLTGGVIDIVNSTVLTMILVVGTSDAIHMVSGFRAAWTRTGSGRTAAAEMVASVGFACLMTSLTTMLGFGSLTFALIGTIKRFGLNMVISVAVTYAVSLLVITALLSFRGAPPPVLASRERSDWMARLLGGLAGLVTRRWRAVVACCAAFGALAAAGIARLEVDSHAVSEVRESSPIKVAMRETENLAGFLGFEVSVRSLDGGNVLEPEVLRRVDALGSHIASRSETIATWSVVDYVKEMNCAAEGGGEEHYAVPDSRQAVEQFLLLYSFSREGGREIQGLVDGERRRLRLVSRVYDVGANAYLSLVRDVEARARDLFAGATPVEVRVTSESYLLHKAMDRIVTDLAQSIAIAFVFVFGAMMLSLASWRLGLLSILPNVLPLLGTLAFMGLVGIPLRVGTIVVFSLGLGIAVDDTIHYFLRFRRCLAETGDYAAAVRHAHLGVGRPIVFTSLILIAGFLALVPAEFLSIQQMGILNGFTLALALAADLTIAPVLLRLVPVRTVQGSAPAPDALEAKEVDREKPLPGLDPGV